MKSEIEVGKTAYAIEYDTRVVAGRCIAAGEKPVLETSSGPTVFVEGNVFPTEFEAWHALFHTACIKRDDVLGTIDRAVAKMAELHANRDPE